MFQSKRLIIIAVAVVLVLAAAGFGIYSLTQRSTTKETERGPQALAASVPTVIWEGARALSVLYTVTNPNSKYAADTFSYKINLYDEHDIAVKSVQRSYFIYAGKTETLVDAKIDTGGNNIGRAAIEIGETHWVPSSDFREPEFKIENLETVKEGTQYLVRAKITNDNNFDIALLSMNAVIYTKNGPELAVVRQDTENAKAGKTKGLISYFTVSPSMAPYIDLTATKFYFYAKK